ncbi:MAG: ATP-binding protein, partial [Gemmatimonadota bacterium]
MATISQQRRSDVRTSAARVGLSYLVVGALWILLSDRILAAWVSDPSLLVRLQTYKGSLFVVVSAVLIWWLVRREVKRVHRSEGYLAVLSEQSIAGTYVIRHGRMAFTNKRFAEIFGYPDRKAVLGMGVEKLIAEEDRQGMLASIQDREAGLLDVAHQTFKGLRADGSQVQLEVFGRTIMWDGERAVAGLLLDITERRRLEQKLRQAASVEALGSLTGAVAHDFNNFLTGIMGNLDLVLGNLREDPEEMRTSLQLVRDSAARAASLTGQLLTFSKGRTFHHRAIDVNRHLRELSDFLTSLCEGGQELRLELASNLPLVMLDPVALDQLVLNLFVNAKDAVGPRGTITVRTRSTSAEGEMPEVFIEVEDSGAGMPQEVLDQIFEPFFTTKEQGTGLGLATVRSIVEEARGHLLVQSEAGRGTTMTAAFPPAPTSARERSVAVVQGQVSAGPHAPTTVLVVDDDAAVRR